MSDPPPARPKPGSLRDRIAAFEQKGPPAAAAAPPPPRPKPGTLSKWAPKPASSPPPPSDAQSHSREGSVEGGTAHGGMSAADAKNAIGAGGSLKERMAALKGIGAFGGGGGSPGGEKPPPPKSEKPKWKPPPVVQMSPPIGGEDDEHVPVVSPPAAAEGVDKEEEGEKEVDDAEEEERQRRAAIAARMARLGGARVGMGPPVFGKKPTPPPKKPSLDANAPERVVSPPAGESKPVERVSSPPAGEETVAESKPAVPAAPEATTPAEAPTSPPPAMPIPAAPRRAAPPRRKTPAKSTPATTTPSLDVVPPTPGQSVDVHAPSPGAATGMPEADEGTRSVAEALADKVRSDDEFREAVPTPASEVKEVVEPPKEHHVELDEEVAKETEPEPTPVPVTETRPEPTRKGSVDVAAGVPVPETPAVEKEAPASIPEHEVPTQRRRSDASDARPESPELADETLGDDEAKEEEVPEVKREEEPVEEEDEGARKKRIAEKVAKMGGFNPFSAPPAPQRKQTMEEPELSGEKQEHPVHEHHDAVAGIAHPTTEAEKEIHDAVEEREGVSVDDISRVQAEEQAATLEPEEVDAMTAGPEVDIDRAVSQSGLPVEVVEKEDEEQKEEKEKFVDEMREFEGEVKSPTLEVPPQPQLERKGSSGSMRSYKVTTIGRGVQPEEDDEDGREHQPTSPEQEQDEHQPYASLDSVPPSALPQSARPPQSGSSSLFSPRPPHVPQDGADEPLLDEQDEEEEGVEEEEIPPPPPARPIMSPPPPPSRAVPPPAPVEEEQDEQEAPPPPPPSAPHPSKRTSVPPPARAPPAPLMFDEPKLEEEEEGPPPPPPSAPRPSKRTSVPPPPAMHDEPEAQEEAPPPPPSAPRPSKRTSVPPPARAPPAPLMHNEPDEESPPPPPPATSRPSKRTSIPPPARPPPTHAPPNPHERAQSPPARKPSVPAGWSPRASLDEGSRRSIDSGTPPPPPPSSRPPQPSEREVLEDSDGDPIDPRFHSPLPRTNTLPTLVAPSTSDQEPAHQDEPVQEQEQEEDPEQARKRSIAARMAKLGGIRFGAPPPMPGARRPTAPAPLTPADDAEPTSVSGEEHGEKEVVSEEPQQQEPEEEEDEQARRQRIAARLAASGGMRFGMIPGQMPAAAPRRRESSDEQPSSPPAQKQRTATLGAAPPVPHAAAPPVPHVSAPSVPHTSAPPVPRTSAPPVPSGARPPPSKPMPAPPPESEYEYAGTESSDGVHVEAEESEAEEMQHDEAAGYDYDDQEEEPVEAEEEEEEEEEEEAPPPPPRPATRAPAVPHGQTRKASTASTGSYETVAPPARPAMGHPQQSDFVMVDNDAPPPPPPGRPAGRAPPSRAAPPPAQVESNQWELPAIPSGGLDMADTSAASDMSASMFSEDSTTYPGTDDPPASHAPASKPIPESMSPEELRAAHNSVGAKLAEVANALLQKSKGTLVGNGSYAGFVSAALSHVPHARVPESSGSSTQYGFKIYHQVASTVHTRAAEILPGDIIVLVDARLKGHKGLHNYSLSVGEGTACVGVVVEFEGKKAKVRCAQANQHVGQATVEAVSYRLEDLKSGSITIYRVLEA